VTSSLTHLQYVFDVTRPAVPALLKGVLSRAADGLAFQGRDTVYVAELLSYAHTDHLYRLAYRSGVTSAISKPRGGGLISRLGVAFSTGASHKLKKGALV
jgi:hypothetical protein